MEPSSLPDATVLPSGLNAATFAMESRAIGSQTDSDVLVSHSCRDEHEQPTARRRPSLLKAMLRTAPFPLIGCPIGAPVLESHRRTVPSLPPVATIRPSRLNAIAATGSSGRRIGSPTG